MPLFDVAAFIYPKATVRNAVGLALSSKTRAVSGGVTQGWRLDRGEWILGTNLSLSR
jgi:hypothetical protein